VNIDEELYASTYKYDTGPGAEAGIAFTTSEKKLLPIELMAKTLTYPERVNRYNYEKLKSLIIRGHD
jgi:hypothetical protein